MENNISKPVLIPLISIAHGISLTLEYFNMKILKCTLPAMLVINLPQRPQRAPKILPWESCVLMWKEGEYFFVFFVAPWDNFF